MNEKLFVCLMLFFSIIFGNQPSHYLLMKKQSVFIPDWRSEILNPNVAYINNFLLTNTGNPNLTTDSIQMQKTQSDASRLTLGKIALEAIGGAAGGTATGLACAMIVGPREFWQGAATFTGITVGLAGGTTLVGNLVMEPNGSFIKSLIGSAVGTALGSGVLVLTALAYRGWEPGEEADWTVAYCGLTLSVLLPISGAVIGYNSKGSVGCLRLSQQENQIAANIPFTRPSNLIYRIQIIKIKF
jgi:hypothetical protein